MSFLDRARSFLVTTSLLTSGTVTIGGQAMLPGDEEPEITSEGWDTLRIPYFMRRANLTAEDLAEWFPLGSRLGVRTWWITGAKPVRVADGLWRADVDFKGWAGDKPAKITVGASAETQSAENAAGPAPGGGGGSVIYAKVEVHENVPTMAVQYLVEDVDTSGKTDLVGRAQTPSPAVPVAATVWDYLTVFTYHWPNGWVLMESAQDRLPGSTAALVTDSYKYVREKSPG